MSAVELRPGDSLNIVWTSVQDTPFGRREVESNFEFTYEEVLSKLKNKGKNGKSRRSGSEGARFSRLVALASNAIRKGKWSTGADISKEEVFEKLLAKFDELSEGEYPNITENARKSLDRLTGDSKSLNTKQRRRLEDTVSQIEGASKD